MIEHESLRRLRAAVVGTGALGSALLYLLGQRGVRDVLLIDPDPVEDRNLQLSPMLRNAAAAAGVSSKKPYKAALLAGEAVRLWGGLPWRPLCAEIADAGWQLLADRDVLLCCTDSALSRAETAWAARCLGKPLLEAGVFGDGIPEWRVSWFAPSEAAACYLCGMREERRAQVLAYAASSSLGCAPLEDAPRMTGTPETLDRAAHAMVDMLEALAGRTSPAQLSTARRSKLKGREWIDEPLTLTRSQHCPWHARTVGEWVPLPWEVPLRDSLHHGGGEDLLLQLSWQICTLARCLHCGSHSEPYERVAKVRRVLPCPHCGCGPLEAVASLSAVRKQDTVAERSPRQLGQPDKHLYLLRAPILTRGRDAATMMRVTRL